MSDLLSGGAWVDFCDFFDTQLSNVYILPPNTRTKGKSFLFVILTALMMWGTVHYHFGYLNFILACIPAGIVLTLMYAEKELSKDD